MKFAEARQLTPGTKVICGNFHDLEKSWNKWKGEFREISMGGALLVRVTSSNLLNSGWKDPDIPGGNDVWFPCTRVWKDE